MVVGVLPQFVCLCPRCERLAFAFVSIHPRAPPNGLKMLFYLLCRRCFHSFCCCCLCFCCCCLCLCFWCCCYFCCCCCYFFFLCCCYCYFFFLCCCYFPCCCCYLCCCCCCCCYFCSSSSSCCCCCCWNVSCDAVRMRRGPSPLPCNQAKQELRVGCGQPHAREHRQARFVALREQHRRLGTPRRGDISTQEG